MNTPISWTLADGTVWPKPNIERDLRYASFERVLELRYHAAWCVSAYKELIAMPERRRREILRQIRAADGDNA